MSVTPHKLQGYKAQLGYTPSGGGAVQIVAGLKELDGSFKADELDATDHGANGWKSRLPGLLDFEANAKLDYIAGDASQQAFRDAILNRSALSITLFPEQGSGEDSYSGSVIVTSFKWSGKTTDLQSADVAMKGAGPFTVVAQS